MRLITRQVLVRALLLTAVLSVGAVWLAGCGGGETRNQGGGGGGSGRAVDYGTLADNRDGQAYKTVKIGPQTWTAQNMNYNTPSGSWCYDDDESNCNIYGRLYDWETATTVCPDGWHLPSKDEWEELLRGIGSSSGKKLKSTSGWNQKGNGTDEFGFAALPGSGRFNFGDLHDERTAEWLRVHLAVGMLGVWWSATEGVGHGDIAFVLTISNTGDAGLDGYKRPEGKSRNYKTNGFSVRCLQDD